MAEKNETFGSSIPALAAKQLAIREEKYANNRKDISDLQVINGNTAWVKLRSSVNKVSDKDLANRASYDPAASDECLSNLSSTEAETFILTGGRDIVGRDQQTNSLEGGTVKGLNFDNEYNPASAYNNNPALGMRPMPGITSLKVASKNTYGTLMMAEVAFTVWTLEDLERAELLFLRPGYTTLLEWGHTSYFDNDGNIKQAGRAQTVKDDTFFTSKSSKLIEAEIEKLRQEADGNYEGMFGFISNFSWSFRKDGGYECTIKVVSKGIILDSLSMGKTSDATEAAGESEKDTDERKSIFHFIFNRLERNTGDIHEFDGKEWLSGGNADAKDIAKYLEPFKVFRTKQQIADGIIFDTDVELQYVTLRTILDIFNKFITPYNPRNREKLCAFSLDYGEKFITVPQHISTNPLHAVPPKIPSNLPSEYKVADTYSIYRDKLHKKMQAHVGDKSDDCLNIMVSTYFVKKCVNSVINGAQEEGVGVFDFLKEVLSGINDAFGEINHLDLFYIHDSEGVYKVIDRKNTQTKNLEEINLTGLSSTIVDINLSSKISPAIASQVSIAAQGNSGNYKDNVEVILKWNAGAVDRHIERKEITATEDEVKSAVAAAEAAAKKRKKYIEDLSNTWNEFNNGGPEASALFTDQKFDEEDWNRLKNESIAELTRFYKEQRRVDKKPVKGVVPVELSLKMLGLTGFKIGTAFRIKRGLLPSKYDEFAYIITGLDHEIGNDNKWYTNIKTQFYAIQ